MAVLLGPAALPLLKVNAPVPMLLIRLAEVANENDDCRSHGLEGVSESARRRLTH